MIDSVLIANRGEIACRIVRTCRRLGIRAVAVYSDADADAMHVALADEAYRIGLPPSRDSYLNIDAVIAAAKSSGARAVHPGYGFLSETAAFAEACAAAGLVFVGPPASAIRAMGSKGAAKAMMEKSGVPILPGYHGDKQDLKTLGDAATAAGYPVLIKPAAGGGGRGMRIVERAADLAGVIKSAKREALSSFGDDHLLIEKYLARPRHIEIQVMADAHGRCVHLFERDCSVQRRHQKVIEEAPAPGMTADLRARMGAAAVAAARAVGYVGAGTVELLLDETGKFYFMEMNTRLQVEHPVTEAITGLDLVELQLRIADGETLPFGQDDLAINGHAIEARIYAEDPRENFRPAPGRIAHLDFPAEGAGVRVDTGVRAGDTIPPDYDAMIAKVIAHGPTRAAALDRLIGALHRTRIAGVAVNTEYLLNILAHPDFAAGRHDTAFAGREEAALLAERDVTGIALAAAAREVAADRARRADEAARETEEPHSPWRVTSGWRMNGAAEHHIHLTWRNDAHRVAVAEPARADLHTDAAAATLDGRSVGIAAFLSGSTVFAFVGGIRRDFVLHDPVQEAEHEAAPGGSLTAPMPATVIEVLVTEGQAVTAGQALMVLEAMKVEQTVRAPSDGTVAKILFKTGDRVPEGATLVEFAEEDGE